MLSAESISCCTLGERSSTSRAVSQTLCAGSIILMAEQDWNINNKVSGESPRPAKKQYQDPAFRHERVFETMALACGKVQDTNLQCRFMKKTS
jgi:hypothetical protein